MPDRISKPLETRVRSLERSLASVRNGSKNRKNVDYSLTGSIMLCSLSATISDNYTVVKIDHNPSAGSFAIATTATDGTGPLIGILIQRGVSGDGVRVQISGVQYVKSGASGTYGGSGVIQAGNKLTISSGAVVLAGEDDTVYFQALESAHLNEDIILVKFSESSTISTNKMFLIKLTEPIPTGYLCDVYENGPTVAATLTGKAATVPFGAVADLPLNIPFFAWRGPNEIPSTPLTPFYTYFIIQTRWM